MAMHHTARPTVLTVNLNTAIDRVIEVENFTVGSHLLGRQLRRHPAGKGVNISLALASMGRDNVATGFVGRGEFDDFERFLSATEPGRVLCQLLSVAGRTRENVTIVDPVARTDTHVRERGFEVKEADIRRMRSKLGLMAAGQAVIVFAGSLPPGMEAADLRMLIAVAGERGAKVALDIGGEVLRQTLGEPAEDQTQRLWLLKPNEAELAQWAGVERFDSEDDLRAAATRLKDRCDMLVVTRGPAGAWLLDDRRLYRGRLELDEAQVLNTVGCGDCLLAGLIDAQVRGFDPSAMLRQGLAWAAANALREDLARLDADVVASLTENVEIETTPY